MIIIKKTYAGHWNISNEKKRFQYSPLEKGDKGGCEVEMIEKGKKQPPPPPLLRGNLSALSHFFPYTGRLLMHAALCKEETENIFSDNYNTISSLSSTNTEVDIPC